MAESFSSWQNVINQKAMLLHRQIASMQQLFLSAGKSEELLAEACAPYYKLLNRLYEDDLPLAKAVDESDLLLHLDGPGLQSVHPRLSLVSGVLGDIRKQVNGMITVLAGIANEGLSLPKEIDLGLCSFATGSLYLGFSLPEANKGEKFLENDPLVAASQSAFKVLDQLTAPINETDAYEKIAAAIPDPMLRDAGLSALHRLAPSGRRGITSIDLTIKGSAAPFWRTLTPETRVRLQEWLDKPPVTTESARVVGVVREIDLDECRFDLRREDGTVMRCVYPISYEKQLKAWLDQTVEVIGQMEIFRGKPRLIFVERMELKS